MSQSSKAPKPVKVLQAGSASHGTDASRSSLVKQQKDTQPRSDAPRHSYTRTPPNGPVPDGQAVTLAVREAVAAPNSSVPDKSDQQIHAEKKVPRASRPSGTYHPSHTPPNGPIQGINEQTVTLKVADLVRIVKEAITSDNVEHLLGLLKTGIDSNTSAGSTPPVVASATTTQHAGPAKKRASKLAYQSIKQVWNKKNCAYEITKAPLVEEVNDYDEYLFVARTRIDKSTEKPTIYIDIKSPIIRDVLAHVLGGVRGVSLKEDKPSIEQKFLFNFLHEIKAYLKTEPEKVSENELISKHLNVLLEYLDSEHQMLESRLQSLLRNNEITYDLLWTIFKPNTEIFTLCLGTGAPRCVRCNYGEERKRNNGTSYFHLEVRYLDFDGETFGEATTVLSIDEFRGAKQITFLPSYPLVYHHQSRQVKKQLMEYGKKFVSLLGVHHCAYEGKAFYFDKDGNIITKTINKSRIMVDPSFFRRRNPNYRKVKIESPWGLGMFVHDPYDEYEDARYEEDIPLQAVKTDPHSLREQELLICNSTVYGYSLELKLWLEFAVAHVSDIIWDESSFESLAIPAHKKKAIQALCEARLGRNSDVVFEDFVAGKGRGLITLLHGPPGVGKTLTAETISEHLRRPLYTVSAGDLGTTANTLEQNLSEILELSSHWDATLLLDEADVFVEKRSTSDLHRNALVCIFLRKLEYYDGIMFLTTNRVQTIDEAFASRIHAPLRYDELTKEARKKVWVGQLRKAITKYGEAKCSPTDVNGLAEKRLNGREITNVTSTALAMAAFDKTVVSLSYLNNAMEFN